MRIVSWNCNMGFEKKRDAIMRLQPDILVLQECSAKDIENTDAPCKHWVGSNKHKGMAIIGFANHEYHIDGLYTEEWPWFLPLRVDDVPLHILGLWACVKDQRIRYVRVTHKAVDHYAKFLSLPQVIIIGDFNSNTMWDRLHRTRSHSELVEKLESLGLVSVYHTLRGEIQGQEVTPTQFMYRNRAKSYHLDFAFVSKALSCSCELLIGNPGEWIDKSDHMPLILTISL
nr:endonuclease/exonuclease/phosphatase family protein [Ktedonobacteraceae bacterium]